MAMARDLTPRRGRGAWFLLVLAVPLLIAGLLGMHTMAAPPDTMSHGDAPAHMAVDAPLSPVAEAGGPPPLTDAPAPHHGDAVMMTCVLALALVILLRARTTPTPLTIAAPMLAPRRELFATQRHPVAPSLTELSILRT